MMTEPGNNAMDTAADIPNLPETYLGASLQGHPPLSFRSGETGNPGLRNIENAQPTTLAKGNGTRTGFCYDVRMRFHTTMVDDDFHPEDPRRIHAIYELLEKAGLLCDAYTPVHARLASPYGLLRLQFPLASKKDILTVHSEEHYEHIRSTSKMTPQEHLETGAGDSVYFNRLTYFCAKLSVSGAVEACRAVANGTVRNAIAIIRPPGHHAGPEKAEGFCMFNNVCVAARVCQRDVPSCRKILIFDWDVHHGNGTQDAFYNDPNILYISVHRNDYDGHNFFYPGRSDSAETYCGVAEGLGKNVNIPWTNPYGGMGDSEYLLAFQTVVMPIALEFNPDLVIISAGFDAAIGDELGMCKVTPPCYAYMTHALMSLAGGKVAVCLEGGYNLDSIAKSALAVTRTLMGEPPDRLVVGRPMERAEADVRKVLRAQAPYWSCLRQYDNRVDLDEIPDEMAGDNFYDIIRIYQYHKLYEKLKMVPLSLPEKRNIQDGQLRNQVIATSNYKEAEVLIVMIHDPPEPIGSYNTETGKVELQQAWLADSTMGYVDWVKDQGYGLIDVNVSKRHKLEDTAQTGPSEELKKLVKFVWESYVDYVDAEHIIVLGIGEAYLGAMHLLMTKKVVDLHTDARPNRWKGIVNVVCGIKPMPLDSNLPEVSNWFKKNSMVIVDKDNALLKTNWKRKRFGNVAQSNHAGPRGLSQMLKHHQENIKDFINEKAGRTTGAESGEDIPENAP